MNKWRSVLVVAVTVLAAVLSWAPVRGQGSTPTPTPTGVWGNTWEGVALGDLSCLHGTLSGGVIVQQDYNDAYWDYRAVECTYTFPGGPKYINFVRLNVDFTRGQQGFTYDPVGVDAKLSGATHESLRWNYGQAAVAEGTNTTVDLPVLDTVDSVYFYFLTDAASGGSGSCAGCTGHVTLRGLTLVQQLDITETPTVTQTATVTRTPTVTLTLGPSSTFQAAGLFPTVDARPMCTYTPVASMTPTRPNMLDAQRTPTATMNPGWPSYCESVSSTMVAEDATIGAICAMVTRVAGQATWTPMYPTLVGQASATARNEGDCAAPFVYGDHAVPAVDVNFTEFARDENGDIIENCYTLIPYVNIGLSSTIRDIVNTLTGQTTVTEENSTLLIEDQQVCIRYRNFSLVIMDVDWMPLASVVLVFSAVMWMISVIRWTP